ncbi:SGNH/GDSL hydrolase family protein [Desulfatibacillum aliphaticivorans]|uniref:SGNH/GDSL hydrolase family protein n=1 Tax=Desulfatibacillum aliphaticivorans TaxID=218208 RepID=UPI0003FCDB11|nr:SGNH/GDSL hydrolase family protein [Desulfatibacillum aliphaticivorans]
MKNRCAVLCLVLALFMFCVPAYATMDAYVPPDVENLIVFGDSLSDSGNIQLITGGASPSASGYWQGRFSNGPTWCEVAADFMDIDNDVLLMESTITNSIVMGKLALTPPVEPETTYGTPIFFNNAFGGAETGACDTDFLFQVNGWLNAGYTIPEKSLVVVWIGGNDFLGMSDPSTAPAVIGNAVNNIYTGMATLTGLGADHIAVCNLPNLGDTPLYHGTDMEDDVLTLTVGFNQALSGALATFSAAYPNVAVYPVDIFSMGEKTHETPAVYGVTNLYDRAIEPAVAAVALDEIDNIAQYAAADGYLYWDDVHPTRAAHKQIAAQVYGTIFMGNANADYIKTEGTTGDAIGIAGVNCTVTSVEFANWGATFQTNRPENMLYGLLDIEAALNTPGDTAEIEIYLPKALPGGYSWYKYINNKWVDFVQVYKDTNGLEGALISADRKTITLYIDDNGEYDLDNVLGLIQDPSGAGVVESDKPADAGKDDNCFVRSMGADASSLLPLAMLAAILGLGLAVRRMR